MGTQYLGRYPGLMTTGVEMKQVGKWAGAAVAVLFCSSVWAQADEARAKKIVSGVCSVPYGGESSGDISQAGWPALGGGVTTIFKSGREHRHARWSPVDPTRWSLWASISRRRSQHLYHPMNPVWLLWGNTPAETSSRCAGLAGCHGPNAQGASSRPGWQDSTLPIRRAS